MEYVGKFHSVQSNPIKVSLPLIALMWNECRSFILFPYFRIVFQFKRRINVPPENLPQKFLEGLPELCAGLIDRQSRELVVADIQDYVTLALSFTWTGSSSTSCWTMS